MIVPLLHNARKPRESRHTSRRFFHQPAKTDEKVIREICVNEKPATRTRSHEARPHLVLMTVGVFVALRQEARLAHQHKLPPRPGALG
jgi:hypothetical protein